MLTSSNTTVDTRAALTEQLPRAVKFRVELGTNQDMALLERSKVRSRDRLLFCL